MFRVFNDLFFLSVRCIFGGGRENGVGENVLAARRQKAVALQMRGGNYLLFSLVTCYTHTLRAS